MPRSFSEKLIVGDTQAALYVMTKHALGDLATYAFLDTLTAPKGKAAGIAVECALQAWWALLPQRSSCEAKFRKSCHNEFHDLTGYLHMLNLKPTP